MGKEALTIFRKSAPTFVSTFSAHGGLNQIEGLDLLLFLEVEVLAFSWYTSLWLYPAFSRASW